MDSSVGGKTAINHPLGKNLIGTFYQPQCVLIDTETLNTLPDRELVSGIGEVVKLALVRDAPFFEWQEKNMTALLARYYSAGSKVDIISMLCHKTLLRFKKNIARESAALDLLARSPCFATDLQIIYV